MTLNAELIRRGDELDLVDSILDGFQETRSGVRFYRSAPGDILVIPPEQTIDLDNDQILEWYRQKLRMTPPVWDRFYSMGDQAAILNQAIVSKRTEHIGGVGITARLLGDLEYELPTVTKGLETESGKVTFLGNGMSPVPALVAERYRRGIVKSPPVIVDVFDYYLFFADFEDIAQSFNDNKLKFPLAAKFERLKALMSAIDENDLVAVQYYVGSGYPPEELKETDLAVNCLGPRASTIGEQLSILGIGGVLYTTEGRNTPLPDNFTEHKLKVRNGSLSHKIIRKY